MFKFIKNAWNKHVSKKPWLEIISEGIESDGRVRLEFDWNSAFIEHIREFGFVGHNEEECVRMYVEALTNKTMSDIEARQPQSSSQPPEIVHDDMGIKRPVKRARTVG